MGNYGISFLLYFHLLFFPPLLLMCIKRFGRDNFQEASKLSSRCEPTKIDWRKFKYMVFDIPNLQATYAERYRQLGKRQKEIPPVCGPLKFTLPLTEQHFQEKPCKYAEVAPTVTCSGTQHLEKYFQDVMDKGGEGLILRNPDSPYEHGRSRGFLKHKVPATTFCSVPFC